MVNKRFTNFQQTAGNTVLGGVTPKRKIENLARTGTEYPIMKIQTQFILSHPEAEPYISN
jgi:hypothetical protein